MLDSGFLNVIAKIFSEFFILEERGIYMCKKIFSFLTVILLVLFFSVLTAKVAMSGAMPSAGDAVYRDMDTSMVSYWLVGHAGIYIGDGYVVHMQWPVCEKTVFLTNFYMKRYWGSFYAGDSKVAGKRVTEANRLLSLAPQYNFFNPKNFDKWSPNGRCDGLVEWCFEKNGNDIVSDNSWTTLSPQLQWKSSKITRRYKSAYGEVARTSPSIGVSSKMEKLL